MCILGQFFHDAMLLCFGCDARFKAIGHRFLVVRAVCRLDKSFRIEGDEWETTSEIIAREHIEDVRC